MSTHENRSAEGETRSMPEGWYYYGAQPPWQAAASAGTKAADLKQAFDKLSRGDVDADTLGKLLALDDKHFWKGALVGAGVVLALTNLPMLKAVMANAMAGAGDVMRNAAPQQSAPPAGEDKPGTETGA
ncbi:hypothetical protein SAMN04487972_102295 [Paracoccus halophilus]|uniref:Uncharacterized protein n=1 Tax=Paracoccus halophilus TaxID=376733 RepID=A0A099F8U6_9RHOB|nr:hypothetical protein [Paracoccus halophilus]KGJ06661.1 hypothetical protein IT41_00310 [Paracoccus halophilus]SFA42365.1 hypothetical protein SAMN04487972_102295 [Paracoccus halophilus]